MTVRPLRPLAGCRRTAHASLLLTLLFLGHAGASGSDLTAPVAPADLAAPATPQRAGDVRLVADVSLLEHRAGLQDPEPPAKEAAADGPAPGAAEVPRGPMPLNSAGYHQPGRAALDWALVVCFLLLPVGLYFAKEHFLVRQTGAPEGSTAPVRRVGSYRDLDERQMDSPPVMVMQQHGNHLQNLLNGMVIAFACVPESISFSMIVGVSPLNGIWAGVFMGLYTSLLGGRPGIIACSSAATAVVLVNINKEFGMGVMALTVFCVGLFQVLAGVLYLSRFIALVPHPVMLGFVNGLSIVVAQSQLKQMREHGDGPWVEKPILIGMILTTMVSMLSAVLAPRIPVVSKAIPAPLAGVLGAVAFSYAIAPWFPSRTLMDVAGEETFAGGIQSIPVWNFPPHQVNWTDTYMWSRVIQTALRMAFVGLLESLLTLKLIDQITGTHGSTRAECFGQGFGNLAASLFGCQGGCALVGQSLLNVSGGGHGRLSGFTMATGLCLSVLVAAPVVGKIPVAALVGLMFLVSIHTFAWGSFGLLRIIDWVDGVVIVAVTVVTIFTDLATAVLCGLFISALSFAWGAARDVRVEEDQTSKGVRTFRLCGPLFFGSAMNFQNRFKPEFIKETKVILDFGSGHVLDHSALDAITKVVERLSQGGKQVEFKHLPDTAKVYLQSMGQKPAH